MSLAESAGRGRLEALRALRDVLAADLDACESMRDKAALSQRYMDALSQIAECEAALPAEKGTALDEFSKRRAARKAPGSKGASG